MSEAEAFHKVHPLQYYNKFISENVRPDGRGLNKFRKTVISAGSIKSAHGSAVVKIGNTSVIAGITAEVAKPDFKSENNGFLVVKVELPALCGDQFAGPKGKTNDKAQVVCNFLNELCTKTHFLSLSDLCIEPGKVAWVLYIDIYCLNYDGNIFDAASIAMITALFNVRLPKATFEDNIVSATKECPIKLNIKHYPIPLSFGIYDSKYVLVDPTSEEEGLLDSSFTIVYNNIGELCSIYKPGGTAINENNLRLCMQRAKTRTSELVDLINSALKADAS